MVLNTFDANVQWQHYISDHSEWSIGLQPMYQTNTNLGSRQIVPDADLFESVYSGTGKKRSIKLCWKEVCDTT
jgi:hypothetical protein